MIGDFFKRVWVYILKHKSDTFEKFDEIHTFVGNRMGTRLDVLRIENDMKFVL